MRALLIRWLRVLGSAWPRMLAWLLLGEAVRSGIIQLAAPLAGTDKVLAMLLVPIAILARLLAYVGMFLAARDAMRAYQRVQGDAPDARGPVARIREFGEVSTAVLVPFFVVYNLVGGVAGDLSDYAVAAYRTNAFNFDGNAFALQLDDGPGVAIVFVGALALRLVLARFGSRLPAPFALLDIYLDAIWVFVAVNGVNSLLGPIATWWQDRAIVAAIGDLRAQLDAAWTGLKVALQATDVLVPLGAQLLVVPLAWTVIAIVVYSRSLAELRADDAAESRIERRLEHLQKTLPPGLRDLVAVISGEWEDKGTPTLVAFRLLRRAGFVPVLYFLGLSAMVFALGRWLERGIIIAIGPHEYGFWVTLAPALAVLALAVVEPIRISLLSAFVDRGLERSVERFGLAGTREEVAETTPDASPDAPADDHAGPGRPLEDLAAREDAYEDASDPAERR